MKATTKLLITAGTAATLAAGYYGVCELSYHQYIRRKDRKPQDDTSDERKTEVQQWFKEGHISDVTVQSFDDLTLHAMMIENHKSDQWVILVHGYGTEGMDMLYRAMRFDKLGYNCLVIDLRGHGLSEGEYIGMGWNDRLDILKWCDWLVEQKPDAGIILYGISMGASAVMMACGEEELNPHVLCAIEDSGYTSVADISSYQLKQKMNLAAQPVMIGLGTLVRNRCHYNVWEASAVEQLKKCRVPMMFIHGEEDDFVPYDMVFENYYACITEKELYTVSDAGHCQADHSPHYMERIDRFIRRFSK